jgi:undecaprenyl-diphosphatase
MKQTFKNFLNARLSREGVLGLHFTIGILVLSIATWIFADLAEDIANGEPLTKTDVRFSNWLHVHETPGLTKVLLGVTNLHSTIGITIMTLIICVILWRMGSRYWIIKLWLTIYGGMLLNRWLKEVFHRARPHFDDPLLSLTTYSFPSGHTMTATVFYGALCIFLISKVRDLQRRIVIVLAALVLISLVGFSRIYLGVHYLTDVVGAMIEGIAWLTISFTAFEMIRLRPRNRRDIDESI